MELPNPRGIGKLGWKPGDTLISAIEQVHRLRDSHTALLVALRWCVAHERECLADHPEVLAKVVATIARAEEVG